MKVCFRPWTSGAIALAAGAATVLAAVPASATTGSLPLPNYADLAVDDGTKRVYVTGGASANTVVVTDFSGHVKKKIDGQYGASGLVLSADGKTLYVALASGDAISAISTETLKETARYGTGAQTCPTHLTRTGSSVWFGYGCDESFNGKIGRLDTAAIPPVVESNQQGSVRFQRAPYLAAAKDNGPVVAGQLELSLSNVTVYSVNGGDLAKGASGEIVGSNLSDLDVAPSGGEFYSATGSRDLVGANATADLAGRGSYHTGAFPDATAASPVGPYVAAGRRTGSGKDVFVYELGGATPRRSFDLGSGAVLASRGLAWSAECKYLFAITQRANDNTPTLRVLLA